MVHLLALQENQPVDLQATAAVVSTEPSTAVEVMAAELSLLILEANRMHREMPS